MSTQTQSPAPVPPTVKPTRFLKWHRYVLGFCLVIFTFELGAFLLIFPWLDNWDLSWVPMHSQILSNIWMSRYFRGALSGLGLLNIYVGFAELVKLLRSIFGQKR
ncbi:MAG: hypothetical protein JO108_30760 [Acidobacteriaceae bacterium]|nr:hypothetical protein [Acidobacteriaceae bacterium]